MALSDELLAELKSKLQITWSESDAELTKMLVRGQRYFNEICDIEFTFEEGSTERELLIERCRYDWNSALDDFETNYHKEVSRLILDTALKQFVAEGEDTSGTGTGT